MITGGVRSSAAPHFPRRELERSVSYVSSPPGLFSFLFVILNAAAAPGGFSVSVLGGKSEVCSVCLVWWRAVSGVYAPER